MFLAPQSNIVNSKDWKDAEWLSYFQLRFQDMRAKRTEVEEEWDAAENQITNISFYNNLWELEVDVPLETNLIEIYMGRTNGKVNYDILPDWQADVQQLQPTKFAMQYFLDWNQDENFWKENKWFRNNKSAYGTGIFCTSHRTVKDYRYELKDQKKKYTGTELLDEKNYSKVEFETNYFFPQNIHPRDFYIDDSAYWEQDLNKADDCILKEKLTWSQFIMRYWDDKSYNINEVQSGTDEDPKNKNDLSIQQDYVIIHHYYHKIDKKYIVVANERKIVYNGLYFYKDWKLPFVLTQHFTNINRIRGDGIPKRVWYIKAYKSEILQDILTGAAMSSWVNLLTWNDDKIGQDWNIWWRWVNIWKTTWGAEKVQQVNTSPNLWFFTTVLNILDDLVVQDTWDNPRAPYTQQSDKVGIVEIMEANKLVRQSAVDENYNIWLDEALTQMLSRIQQYAPSLMATETVSEETGEVMKVTYPSITMKNYEVEKKKWEKVIKESLWKYGYFELTPDSIPWLWVKVITSSTNSITPILERGKINEYIQNIVSLFNVAQMDQTGEMMKELNKWVRFEDLLDWMNDSYGYDADWLKANTQKDDLRKENAKLMDNLKEILKTNQWWNVQQNNQISMQGWNQEIQWGLQTTWIEEWGNNTDVQQLGREVQWNG